jgi:hypothetical protein
MFKPGDVLSLSVIDSDAGATTYHSCTVVEYDHGLLKVDQFGTVTVYNMRSLNFVKATKQK